MLRYRTLIERFAVSDLPEHAPHSRGTHIVAGVLSTLLICGAAAATLGILGRPHDRVARPRVIAEHIEGTMALRLDLFRRARWPFAANGGFAAPGTEPTPHAHPRTVPPGFVPQDRPFRIELMRGNERVVRDFYHRLGTDPAGALPMLSPRLRGDQHAQLVRAWEATDSVRVRRMAAMRDGAMLADVIAFYADGSRVDLRYLLRVQQGSTPRLIDAKLLAGRQL